MMEIGVNSSTVPDSLSDSEYTPIECLTNLIEEAETADQCGLDAFSIGERDMGESTGPTPSIILTEIAARTSSIRLHGAVMLLGTTDPIKVFREFATLGLLSNGRAEVVVGRGSFVETFPLFGMPLELYDNLFSENLEIFLKLHKRTQITCFDRFRASLPAQQLAPIPNQSLLPVWLVGGTPQSFVRAGALGLPLMVSVIGGNLQRYRSLVDLYREAGVRAGHPIEQLRIGIQVPGFVSDRFNDAVEAIYSGWERMRSTVGEEQGWAPPSRYEFEALCGSEGAYLIGDAKTVAEKILHADRILGGVSRISINMDFASAVHELKKRSIELLGSRVSTFVRNANRPLQQNQHSELRSSRKHRHRKQIAKEKASASSRSSASVEGA